MPFVRFIESLKQGWNDVFDFTENIVCDICGKSDKVKMGQIPMLTCGFDGPVNIGHTSWRLCQDCHDKGWQPPDKHNFGMMYFNSKTNEFKHV